MPTKKQSNAQSKKSLLLGIDDSDKKIIHFDNPKVDVEIRSISIGELEKLRKKAKVDIQNIDQSEIFPFLIWAIIYCCYDPDTGEKLFDETDYERFLELRANSGWFTKLSQEVSAFIGSWGSPEESKKSIEG